MTSTNYSVGIPNEETGTVAYVLTTRPQVWATDNGTTRGFDCIPDFTPTAGATNQSSCYIGGQFGSNRNGQTITNAYSLYTTNSFTGHNVGSTITNVYGMYYDGGTVPTGAVTNSYGLFVKAPAFGTNVYCASFTGGVSLFGSTTVIPPSGFAQTSPLQTYTPATNQGVVFAGLQSSSTTCNVGITFNNSAGAYNNIVQTGDSAIVYSGTSVSNRGGFCIAPWTGATGGIRITATGAVGIGYSPTPSSPVGLYLPTFGGTPANLNFYEEYSSTITFQNSTGSATNTANANILLYRVGKCVSAILQSVSVVMSDQNAFITTSAPIVVRLRPQVEARSIIMAQTNGLSNATVLGLLSFSPTGSINIYSNAGYGVFTANATGCGFAYSAISNYVTN